MASPQKENGYTAIANELMEALARIRIPGEAMQVFLYILRKTYGYNKPEDAVSLSQFVLGTGLKKNSVCRGLTKLKALNIIHQKGYSVAHIYRVNKDFTTWTPFTKKSTDSPKSERGVLQKVNKQSPKKSTTKVDKVDITKVDIAAVPPSEIQELIKTFIDNINPHIKYENKTERKACEDLIKTYGLQKTIDSVKYIASKQATDQYMPKVTTPYELWTKWAKLKIYFESKTNKKSNVIII